MNEVYKIKETGSGADKIIPKDDNFNPPSDKEGGYSRLLRAIETLYEGAIILGTDKLLKWEMSTNMMRPKSDFTKVKMNYAICAPRMYEGEIDSLVKRITGFADMIQLTHLKLQQVMSRLVPDGVYLDADGLAEVDLGNGTNYNPQEALNMFFQTGSVIGRSLTSEGVVIDYVDPANLVYSYTDSPYFDDLYYVGEVKSIPVNELAKQFPHLTESDLEDIMNNKYTNRSNYNSRYSVDNEDNNTIQVLYFNYKTYMNEVYKI